MWKKYHSLRTGCDAVSSIFVRFVGHSIFKELIKTKHCSNNTAKSNHDSDDLTHLEYKAIQYTAGYVPHALKKKIAKARHSNKKDFLQCLDDLLMCEGKHPGPSADWIHAVDRGGLIHINNITFELFLSMEHNIRHCVKAGHELGDIRSLLKGKEDALFYWSILTAT